MRHTYLSFYNSTGIALPCITYTERIYAPTEMRDERTGRMTGRSCTAPVPPFSGGLHLHALRFHSDIASRLDELAKF